MMARFSCPACFLFLCLLAPVGRCEDPERPSGLFPVGQPFHSGHLRVSDRHSIHFMLFGNPEGKPVFVLHGGPGFGCYPRLVQYFDPKKFLIVLHDQRGAGRSVPLGEIRENTTQDLVADIEVLRGHVYDLLKVEGRFMIFGGSWGSTLGLAYAETHPERVSAIILRGLFLGSEPEIANVWSGTTSRSFFPEARAEFEDALPPDCEEFTPGVMLEFLQSDDKKTRVTVLRAWTRFAIKIGRLHATDEMVNESYGAADMLPCARIDAHYASNGFFLGDNELLDNAHKLKGIPTVIINGRYDMVCPPLAAYRLHERLPHSKLIIVEEAGHSEGEEGTTEALLRAVAEFE